MSIRVGLRVTTRLAKRLADAVAAQNDTQLADVAESTDELVSACDVLVDVGDTGIHIFEAGDSLDFQQRDDAVAFTSSTASSKPDRGNALIVPGTDAVALARVVGALGDHGEVKRLYATILSREAPAPNSAQSSLDALEPVVGETDLDAQLKLVFAGVVPDCQARRVLAPYTHSHLLMIKLDMAASIERDTVVNALRKDSRILLGAAGDGFRSTADINEFFRDLGRGRGERWEAFVWDESIMVVNQNVYLMLDVSPDAVAIPETIDAIRLIARPQLDLASIRKLTDESLGLLQSTTA